MANVAGKPASIPDRRFPDEPFLPDLVAHRPVAIAEGLTLRLLQWGDLPQIESLIQRCREAEQTWTQRTLSRSLVRWPASNDRAIVGMVETRTSGGEQLCGIAAIAPDLGQYGCADVAILVDPDHRGHGLGMRLAQAILQVAGALDYRAVTVRVNRANHAFLRIAARLGLASNESVGAEPLLLRGATTGVPAHRAGRVRLS